MLEFQVWPIVKIKTVLPVIENIHVPNVKENFMLKEENVLKNVEKVTCSKKINVANAKSKVVSNVKLLPNVQNVLKKWL